METPAVMLPVEIILGLVSDPKKYGSEIYNKDLLTKLPVSLFEAVTETSAELQVKRKKIAYDTFNDPSEQERINGAFDSRFAKLFNIPRTVEGFEMLMQIGYLTEMGNIIAQFKQMPASVASHLALAILIDVAVPTKLTHNEEYLNRMIAGADAVKKIVAEHGGAENILQGEDGGAFAEAVNERLEQVMKGPISGISESEEDRIKKIIAEARQLSQGEN